MHGNFFVSMARDVNASNRALQWGLFLCMCYLIWFVTVRWFISQIMTAWNRIDFLSGFYARTVKWVWKVIMIMLWAIMTWKLRRLRHTFNSRVMDYIHIDCLLSQLFRVHFFLANIHHIDAVHVIIWILIPTQTETCRRSEWRTGQQPAIEVGSLFLLGWLAW